MLITAPIRENDKFGSGYFGASRDGGKRQHKGVDYAVYPGSLVYAHVGGTVTKLGFPYGDDLGFRYVQITDTKTNYNLRYLRKYYLLCLFTYYGTCLCNICFY